MPPPSKPVDLDLVNNTLRLPYRERLTIIINELGTGLAGRGGDLRLAIRNANPALKETDKVLRILADQNRTLANLARNSDVILAPLARDRARVANFVTQAKITSQATAEPPATAAGAGTAAASPPPSALITARSVSGSRPSTAPPTTSE